jgi:uncharacterized protein YndB with AHSA1/START domain
VTAADLVFERMIALAPVIVWDALVDPDLLDGWLGEVRVDPSAGRVFSVIPGATGVPVSCELLASEPPGRLAVRAVDGRDFEFVLVEHRGGSRGTSTALRLRVRLDFDAAFAGGMRAAWEASLDRLIDLLRGRPTDWAVVRGERDAVDDASRSQRPPAS